MSDSIERLGEFMMRLGALNQEQVDEIVAFQNENQPILFGQAAIRLGYITEELLDKYL